MFDLSIFSNFLWSKFFSIEEVLPSIFRRTLIQSKNLESLMLTLSFTHSLSSLSSHSLTLSLLYLYIYLLLIQFYVTDPSSCFFSFFFRKLESASSFHSSHSCSKWLCCQLQLKNNKNRTSKLFFECFWKDYISRLFYDTFVVILQNKTNETKMLKVLISKLLIVAFVGSVTLWYIFTPYLVQPHKRIMNDL